ncbi:MAG: response regulator transcription factor [Bacillota bacterium]
MRVILVDDYPPFIDALTALLRSRSGIVVVGRAHNGKDGLKLAAELEPDLVLVDFSMPDMDGLSVTRRLKAGPKPPKVVIVTSHMEPEYKDMAMQSGADGFVVKSEIYQDLIPQLEAINA